MPDDSNSPILICGAGIAGLTLAISLGKAGFRVVVLEASEQLEAIGAGIQISPNAWHVLAGLGLEEKLHQKSSFPSNIRVYDGVNGNALSKLPLGPDFAEQFSAPYGVIHRGDLQAILLKACIGTPNTELRLSHRVQAFSKTSGGVRVHFDNREDIHGQLLVAADGVNSTIRKKLTGAPGTEYSGKIAWRALAPIEDLEDERFLDDTSIWLAPDCHMVAYPVSSGRKLNLVLIQQGDQQTASKPSAVQPSNFKKLQAANARRLIASAGNWSAWPIHVLSGHPIMKHSGVALVGDAAHAMLPFAAQGAAMAIEDAAILSLSIQQFGTGSTALQHYNKQRFDRNRAVTSFADANGRIYHLSFPLSFARNLVMKSVPGHLMIKRQDWIYSWLANQL